MWTLVALAASWIAKNFTFEIAKYIALRAMLIALTLAIGPIVLFKGWSMIMQFLLGYVTNYIQGQGLQSAVIEMVGIGCYLAGKLKIGEGISLYLSLLSISFTLRMIRVK
jgi:hypothetical protein